MGIWFKLPEERFQSRSFSKTTLLLRYERSSTSHSDRKLMENGNGNWSGKSCPRGDEAFGDMNPAPLFPAPPDDDDPDAVEPRRANSDAAFVADDEPVLDDLW
jgi:hypothetical protein